MEVGLEGRKEPGAPGASGIPQQEAVRPGSGQRRLHAGEEMSVRGAERTEAECKSANLCTEKQIKCENQSAAAPMDTSVPQCNAKTRLHSLEEDKMTLYN